MNWWRWALPLVAGLAWAGEGMQLPTPETRTLCPVCGMFVSKYPEWTATLVWRDGHALHFDGVKDMVKCLRDRTRYAPDHAHEEPALLAVTDYYTLTRVDARQAWYVLGSDVAGPMGRELVPLASENDARDFMADHHGQRLLRFDELTLELVKGLDAPGP